MSFEMKQLLVDRSSSILFCEYFHLFMKISLTSISSNLIVLIYFNYALAHAPHRWYYDGRPFILIFTAVRQLVLQFCVRLWSFWPPTSSPRSPSSSPFSSATLSSGQVLLIFSTLIFPLKKCISPSAETLSQSPPKSSTSCCLPLEVPVQGLAWSRDYRWFAIIEKNTVYRKLSVKNNFCSECCGAEKPST